MATEHTLVRIATDPDFVSKSNPSLLRDVRSDLRCWNVQAVVVGPMPRHERVVVLMSTVVGQPLLAEDGVDRMVGRARGIGGAQQLGALR